MKVEKLEASFAHHTNADSFFLVFGLFLCHAKFRCESDFVLLCKLSLNVFVANVNVSF